MTSRAVRFSILLMVTLTAAPAMVRPQVSLATVVDLAQRNSTGVRAAQTDVQKAQSVLAQTQDAYIPNLTVGSTVGGSIGFPTGQPSIANASMQSLVLSFQQRQYLRAAHEGVQAASAGLKDVREQVALDASTAYLELDTVKQELVAAHQQEGFADRFVQIEQQRTDAGVDPLSELLQAKLTGAQLRLKRLHLETRAATLSKQLATLTGLPDGSILTDHASIPEIPAINGEMASPSTQGIQAAELLAHSRELQAKGDALAGRRPQISFGAQYNLDSNTLNNYSTYYRNFTPNNFSAGFSIEIPIFDFGLRAKSRQSAAEALRARIEAEQSQRQNELQIAELSGSIRELDTQAEIASLKQQIAGDQLKTVLAQLELGTGSGSGSQPQITPKAEQLACIDERQKLQDALDAGFDLAKARLSLLRSLGHMEDWLRELHGK
jgi:outer membrane protein TolC